MLYRDMAEGENDPKDRFVNQLVFVAEEDVHYARQHILDSDDNRLALIEKIREHLPQCRFQEFESLPISSQSKDWKGMVLFGIKAIKIVADLESLA
jgi:hypothetical protein